MANTKISNLTASASNLAASDLVPVVQTPGVGPVKMTGTQIKTGIIGAGSVSIASGKTFTSNNTLTLAGTDGTTMTFPSTSATLARTDAGNTFTGAQTFSVGTVNGTGLDISQTWTGTGTYTGLKYNVGTDSGPANAASLLLDLQLGGVSQFNVGKTASNLFTARGHIFISDALALVVTNSSGTRSLATRSDFTQIPSAASYRWGDMSSFAADLFLTRADTATLQLGAADTTGTTAPTAQFLRVQSWSSSTNNNQTGANFTIQGSRGTGTGAGGSIIFQVAPAGSSGTAQNAYSTALTIDSTRLVTLGGNLSSSTSNFVISSAATITLNNATNIGGALATSFPNVVISSSYALGFSDGAVTGTVDVKLLRDGAANTLALRNGTSAQKFRVYNTYTSSTNYENFEIDWQTTANIALVGPTKGSGGGTQRVQRLQYLEDGGTGSTTPSLGTTCPAASATIKSWIKVITSDGTTAYIPCWA